MHRYWYCFDWHDTDGKAHMGWCFGDNEDQAHADAIQWASRHVSPRVRELLATARCYLTQNCGVRGECNHIAGEVR